MGGRGAFFRMFPALGMRRRFGILFTSIRIGGVAAGSNHSFLRMRLGDRRLVPGGGV